MRKKQQYAQASAHLKVYKKELNDGSFDYDFAFLHHLPSEEKDDHTELPSEVKTRKDNIEKVRVFAKLFINGKFVSQTKKMRLQYPQFKSELCEMF